MSFYTLYRLYGKCIWQLASINTNLKVYIIDEATQQNRIRKIEKELNSR